MVGRAAGLLITRARGFDEQDEVNSVKRQLGVVPFALVLSATAGCGKCGALPSRPVATDLSVVPPMSALAHKPPQLQPLQVLALGHSAGQPDLIRSDQTDCTRGEPQPLLRAIGQVKPDFRLQGPFISYETAQLNSTTMVHVRQSGCITAVEEVTFVSTNPASNQPRHLPSPMELLQQASSLLAQTPVVQSYEMSFRILAKALRKAAKSAYQPGESIDISENETVTVSAKSTDQATEIVITRTIIL